MDIKIIKTINNNKFSKIIQHNDLFYIFGIYSSRLDDDHINKFCIFYDKYNINLEFIEKKQISYEFEKSTLVWDIIEDKEYYIFLIEQKSIDHLKHKCQFYKYFIKKKNIETFIVDKIEKLNLENYLISKIKYNITFASKLEIDEERHDYYWGKYLFNFKDKNNNFYQPQFDNIVNYKKDKGHLLHFCEELLNNNFYGDTINKKYFIIFSIRHKCCEDNTKYYYKIYSSISDDLKHFYNTREIKIENNITDSKWYCYPEIFKMNEKYYVLLCQDDFGKEKETLIGELIINH